MEYDIPKLILCFLLTLMCGVINSKENPKCCLPEVFEVFVGIHGGTNAGCALEYYKSEYLLYYDYPNQRWGAIYSKQMRNKDRSGYMIMEDYKNDEVIRAPHNKCVRSTLNSSWEMYPYCLPEEAEFSETVTMGYGEQTLTYDTWKWTRQITDYNGNETTMYMTTGVTEQCTFINELSLWQETSGKFNMTNYFAFFDVIPGQLSQDNVFNKFSKMTQCKQSEDLGEMMDPFKSRDVTFLANRLRRIPTTAETPTTAADGYDG